MDVRQIPFETIDGERTTLARYGDDVLLIVNVASKCGFTPQYEQLEALWRQYGPRGLTVLGVPCNQFMNQEPGDAEEIKRFCSLTYDVTFPLAAKALVRGPHRHPLFAALTTIPDAKGKAGTVRWNFEKFLLAPDGRAARFRSATTPSDPAVVAWIEEALAARDAQRSSAATTSSSLVSPKTA